MGAENAIKEQALDESAGYSWYSAMTLSISASISVFNKNVTSVLLEEFLAMNLGILSCSVFFIF